MKLIARRELTERVRERSFLIGTGISVLIIALVVVLPPLLGFGGTTTYTVATTSGDAAAVARTAERDAGAFDAKLKVRALTPAAAEAALRSGDVDIVLGGGEIRSKQKPDAKLVGLIQGADALDRAGAAGDAAPLRVVTIEPVNERRDKLGGLAFFTILLLYGQLLTYGVWVASGVVEEKTSRVVEVLLSTIRPRELLAGKVIGLGLLGLGQLLLIAAIGLGIASASGAVTVDGDLLSAVGLTLVWFALGYTFFACVFGCAGALVPRLEELQAPRRR